MHYAICAEYLGSPLSFELLLPQAVCLLADINVVEIRLKEVPTPTLWERFLSWLNDEEEAALPSVRQAPKTGTNTEILLSQTQKSQLQTALDAPPEFMGDTAFFKPRRCDDESKLII
jgi:hypothetical protein